MKIQDRINAIKGVEATYWDGKQNRLVVYYCLSYPIDTIKIMVAGAIEDAWLLNSIEKITLIGC